MFALLITGCVACGKSRDDEPSKTEDSMFSFSIIQEGKLKIDGIREGFEVPQEVNIPSQIYYEDELYDISEIGNDVFTDCTNLESVKIPTTITRIGNMFKNCSSLSSVYFDNDILNCNVSYGLFYSGNCDNLENIYFQKNTIEQVESAEINGLYKLNPRTIHCKDGEKYVGLGYKYNLDDGSYVYYAGPFSGSVTLDKSKVVSIEVPNGIETIERNSIVEEMVNLRTIRIPSTVTRIETPNVLNRAQDIYVESKTYSEFTSCGFNIGYINKASTVHCKDKTIKVGKYIYATSENGETATIGNIEEPVSIVIPYGYNDDNINISNSEKIRNIEIYATSEDIEFNTNALYDMPRHSNILAPEMTLDELKELVKNKSIDSCFLHCKDGEVLYGGVEYQLNDGTFVYNKAKYIYEKSDVVSIVVPGNASLETIGEEYSNLITIVLHEGVKDVHCEQCHKLVNVTLPQSITSVFFSGCDALTTISLPSGVKEIGTYAFAQCTSLSQIVLPEGLESIGEYAFYGCTSLSSINIPSTVTSLGERCFSACESLISVTIPSGVTDIKEGTFQDCSGLTYVNLSNGLGVVNEFAFDGCTSLSSINLPSTVTELKNGCFRNCTSLKSITIPNGVEEIQDSAFQYCSGLTQIVLPEGLLNIGSWAFSGCVSLKNIALPSTLISVGEQSFIHCESIETVVLPEGVTSIGALAFANCDKLRQVTIPGTVENLEKSAFNSCPLLECVVYSGTDETVLTNILFDRTSIISYVYVNNTIQNTEVLTDRGYEKAEQSEINGYDLYYKQNS